MKFFYGDIWLSTIHYMLEYSYIYFDYEVHP